MRSPYTGGTTSLHGGCVLPTRGFRSPYPEGLTSLHGKTGFAAGAGRPPCHAARSAADFYLHGIPVGVESRTSGVGKNTLLGIFNRVAGLLKPVRERLLGIVRKADFAQGDETGWRISRGAGMSVAVGGNAARTASDIDRKPVAAAAAEIILPDFISGQILKCARSMSTTSIFGAVFHAPRVKSGTSIGRERFVALVSVSSQRQPVVARS